MELGKKQIRAHIYSLEIIFNKVFLPKSLHTRKETRPPIPILQEVENKAMDYRPKKAPKLSGHMSLRVYQMMEAGGLCGSVTVYMTMCRVSITITDKSEFTEINHSLHVEWKYEDDLS